MLQKTIKYLRRFPTNFKKTDFHLFEREISRSLHVEKKILNINHITLQKNGYILQILKFSDYFIPLDEINLFKTKKTLLIIKILFSKLFNINKIKKFDKEIFFVHDIRSYGYYHFINDVGQKLELIKEKYPKKKIKVYFPSTINIEWVKKVCEIYNFSFYYHKTKENVLFTKAKLVYPVSLSGNPEENLFRKMNKRFSKFISKSNLSSKKKIYISRQHAEFRYLKNEHKLISFLNKKKFKNYHFEKISFNQQLEILKKTNTIVGPHGAGLINMVWLKPGSNIIEIRGDDDNWNNCYFSAASALRHNYKYILANTTRSILFKHKIKNYSFNLRGLTDISEIF